MLMRITRGIAHWIVKDWKIQKYKKFKHFSYYAWLMCRKTLEIIGSRSVKDYTWRCLFHIWKLEHLVISTIEKSRLFYMPYIEKGSWKSLEFWVSRIVLQKQSHLEVKCYILSNFRLIPHYIRKQQRFYSIHLIPFTPSQDRVVKG